MTAKDPNGLKAVSRTDSDLAVLAFAYDSQTIGNAATEIVKYYLQLHYGIKKDYRNFDLAEARQLLRVELRRDMGAINARPARINDWTAKSIGTVWRAFDLQLATTPCSSPASAWRWPTATASPAAMAPWQQARCCCAACCGRRSRS